MRVVIPFEVDEYERQAIAEKLGKRKPALWKDVRQWIEQLVEQELAELVRQMESAAALEDADGQAYESSV